MKKNKKLNKPKLIYGEIPNNKSTRTEIRSKIREESVSDDQYGYQKSKDIFNYYEIDKQLSSRTQKVMASVMRVSAINSLLEFIGKYILSPVVIICTSISSIIICLLMVYAIYNNSYQPFGGEVIVAVIFGWLLGAIISFVTKLKLTNL